jgi:anti-sigma28 factor (negative regulator of flagellin synthesis)
MRRRTWNSWTFSEPEEQPDSSVRSFLEFGCYAMRDKCCGGAVRMEQTLQRTTFQRTMAELLEEAMDPSDVRMERVARIRTAIGEGTYLPDVAGLAQKLIETMRGEFR